MICYNPPEPHHKSDQIAILVCEPTDCVIEKNASRCQIRVERFSDFRFEVLFRQFDLEYLRRRTLEHIIHWQVSSISCVKDLDGDYLWVAWGND
jgi:hypothetical protein